LGTQSISLKIHDVGNLRISFGAGSASSFAWASFSHSIRTVRSRKSSLGYKRRYLLYVMAKFGFVCCSGVAVLLVRLRYNSAATHLSGRDQTLDEVVARLPLGFSFATSNPRKLASESWPIYSRDHLLPSETVPPTLYMLASSSAITRKLSLRTLVIANMLYNSEFPTRLDLVL
jgi:hypothetical protein